LCSIIEFGELLVLIEFPARRMPPRQSGSRNKLPRAYFGGIRPMSKIAKRQQLLNQGAAIL
jgi:hypothetical protein